MSEDSKRGHQLEAHRKAAREWAKRDYDKNRDARVAMRKKWRHEHPEYVLLRNAKKRAKEKGLEFTLTAEDIHIPEVCPLLGIPILRNLNGVGATPNSPTLDRIDTSKGYTRDNVWVTSWRANKLKSDASLEELEKLVSGLKTKLRD